MIPSLKVQVKQALRYAKAIRGQPEDPSLAMRHDEGLGGWTPLLLVQSVYALWDAILLSPAPPPEARGPCPAQGYQYALAVYHYTRCLALAARCSANHTSLACSQAREELQLLQVGPALLTMLSLGCKTCFRLVSLQRCSLIHSTVDTRTLSPLGCSVLKTWCIMCCYAKSSRDRSADAIPTFV